MRTSPLGLKTAVGLVCVSALIGLASPGLAQEMEPKAYSASPVGGRFLVLALGRSSGGIVFDPAVPITDAEALQAFHNLCRLEGIIPALESSHAIAYAAKLAPTLSRDKILLVNLSGRGDKDIHTVAEKSGITF